MATLKDVALHAGVSVRTVSNVVNEWPHVSAALRQRVKDAIEELGYSPNLAARNLRNGQSGLIAVVVPELDVPYFAELARCLVAESVRHGRAVVIEQTDGDLDRERELVNRNSRASLFDGMIFSPAAMTAEEIDEHHSSGPVVLLGEQHAGNFDHVLIDNVVAAQDATRHLISSGRRRIALVGDRPSVRRNTSRLRRQGYEAALREAGIDIDPALIPSTQKFHRADGRVAMHELLALEEPPDAVFCLNDSMAIGALRALSEAGRRVPAEIAVVGFDGVEEGRFHSPSLTSVAPDKQALAERAIALLLERIDSRQEITARREIVPHTLQLGESTEGRAASSLPWI